MTEFIIAWNTQVVVLQNPFTIHTTTNDKLKENHHRTVCTANLFHYQSMNLNILGQIAKTEFMRCHVIYTWKHGIFDCWQM